MHWGQVLLYFDLENYKYQIVHLLRKIYRNKKGRQRKSRVTTLRVPLFAEFSCFVCLVAKLIRFVLLLEQRNENIHK